LCSSEIKRWGEYVEGAVTAYYYNFSTPIRMQPVAARDIKTCGTDPEKQNLLKTLTLNIKAYHLRMECRANKNIRNTVTFEKGERVLVSNKIKQPNGPSKMEERFSGLFAVFKVVIKKAVLIKCFLTFITLNMRHLRKYYDPEDLTAIFHEKLD
jgi:hypothetical protein